MTGRLDHHLSYMQHGNIVWLMFANFSISQRQEKNGSTIEFIGLEPRTVRMKEEAMTLKDVGIQMAEDTV
jgi:hypothetical protein